ncbi:AGE family epimerase/isomerase [Parvularcula oceani]|uniref:AGE family epimerase/isomerase n=1 Tax=Parvularcula oceani TaxID=1247963 RepID=UPI0004E0B5ED|nr:AGE family epimerase/isomerase [Parvularcula oceani]
MTALEEANARLKAWLTEHALPVWGRRGRDHRGGFYEALAPDGAPLMDRTKRFRVHPRMAYAFAHAEALGWTDLGRSASDHAWSFTLEAGTDDGSLSGDGPFTGFVHCLTPEGGVEDGRRDTYDHAFVLLAAAWRLRVFGDEQAGEVAKRTLSFLDRLRQDDGSYLEGVPAALPRRQNPHMHLFEAFLALHAAGVESALERARAIHALFTERFWDGAVLREFFTQDWALDPQRGDLVEPGHMAEWCWLLDGYEEATGEDQSALIMSLYEAAERTGLGASGLLIDEAHTDGAPSRATRRLWVQGEYAKGTLVLARRGKDGMADKAARLIGRFMDDYLGTPMPGGWYDQYDENGDIVSEDMPASSFYHIVSLAAEADRTVAAL